MTLGSEGFFNMKTTAEGTRRRGNRLKFMPSRFCNGNDDDAFVNEERINAGVLKALGAKQKTMKKFAVWIAAGS